MSTDPIVQLSFSRTYPKVVSCLMRISSAIRFWILVLRSKAFDLEVDLK